jgi:hypothetical protein
MANCLAYFVKLDFVNEGYRRDGGIQIQPEEPATGHDWP